MGYHKRKIEKGKVGEISKIREEVEELIDSEEQGNKIMALVELSDIVGAIQAYINKHHSSITFDDLMVMAKATSKAFKEGSRK
jgi:hypothetical protein